MNEDTCVVCFKKFEIYSIGECDHPVCYECSTRMRVLCQQNECPICRQNLAKVIFTTEKKNYKDLERKKQMEHYNKKYRIAFSSIAVQKAFYTLLQHSCPLCKCPTFLTFDALKDHVRKEHEQFYCDICTDHLKIFSFERKCYSRQDLGIHRRKGDSDNTSHRGHPLCQYCDTRFLDRDELFRHLRKEHYFCHFCDADGSNEFYADYESLRQHFQEKHFVCEEGNCIREQFTAVFRSEIDLKAHIYNMHGKSLGKLQAKQARTLQLEINLEPRGRTFPQNDSQRNSRSNAGEYNGESIHNILDFTDQPMVQKNPITTIDARNEREFPSLCGPTTTTPNFLAPNISLMHKSTSSGIAKTKENFPALTNDLHSINSNTSNTEKHKLASAIVKKSEPLDSKPKKSLHIHVSNRPTSTISNTHEFPALPKKVSAQKKLQEDLIPSNINKDVKIASKHRILLDDYVSVAAPQQKLQIMQTIDQKPKVSPEKSSSIKLTINDFPALGPASVAPTPINWGKQSQMKQTKVLLTKTPLYNKNQLEKKNNSNTKLNNNCVKMTKLTKQSNKIKKNENNNEYIADRNIENSNSLTESRKLKTNKSLQSISTNSVAKLKNDLTFTTSLGETSNIIQNNLIFTPPTDSTLRNQALISEFAQHMENSVAFEEFRNVSRGFRDGNYSASEFFQHCQTALRNRFDEGFPELLALLPDIMKQQELYLVYSQYLAKNKKKPKKGSILQVCTSCKQVVKDSDLDDHLKSHNLNINFPGLKIN